MAKSRILIQLDTDRHPSVFDYVVAVDAGADHIASFGGVEPGHVEEIVHGTMFTRGANDLRYTAIFVGGRNVTRAEELLAAVQKTFFGPVRCSVMMDASGANTTAAAAVLAARRHLDLERASALVLGGTGPVGQRTALLLAQQKASIWIGSRTTERAEDVCNSITAKFPSARVFPVAVADPASVGRHPEKFQLVVSAGAAGVRVMERDAISKNSQLKVVIDLNAVPPSGIEGVEPTDHGREQDGIYHYGALGVGWVKMKIHKAAVAKLFEANDLVLDAEEILKLGIELAGNKSE